MVWLETCSTRVCVLGASSTPTLDLTVKCHKGPGYVTFRNIHSLASYSLEGLSQWAARGLRVWLVRGSFSASLPRSSFARVHRVLISHMEEEESEEQENEKEDEREGGKQRVEGRVVESIKSTAS